MAGSRQVSGIPEGPENVFTNERRILSQYLLNRVAIRQHPDDLVDWHPGASHARLAVADERVNRYSAEGRVSTSKFNSTPRSLLIHARRQKAAVDHDALAGDEAGRIGGEQNGRAGQLRGPAEAAHGSAQEQLLAALGPI
jgi:hypothetical protein